MIRLLNAWHNSMRALRRLAAGEAAFRLELGVLACALPLAWLLAPSWRGFALLIGVVLLLMLVEVLNTGIEAACDAVSPEFDRNIQIAKDCGSLAVLIAAVIGGAVWLLALAEAIVGHAV